MKNTQNYKNLKEIAEEVKTMEKDANGIVVDLLKDTIKDDDRYNKRLFILSMFLIVAILLIVFYSHFTISKQNEKYADFLSQFEFEGDVYQDTDDFSTIYDGIQINK